MIDKMKKQEIRDLEERNLNKMLITIGLSALVYFALFYLNSLFGNLKFLPILKSGPLLPIISAIFAIIGALMLVFVIRNGKNDIKKRMFIKLATLCVALFVSVYFIYKCDIRAITIIAILLLIYDIGAIIYYSYYREFKKNPKLKFKFYGISTIALFAICIIFRVRLASFFFAVVNTFIWKTPLTTTNQLIIPIVIIALFGIIIGVLTSIKGFSKK